MLTRRNFLMAAAGTASVLLAGCASEPESGQRVQSDAAAVRGSEIADEPAADAPANEGAASAGATLVAYFSATGNTESVATAIADRLGADVFAIEAAEPYTDADLNYNDDASRTSVERADGTNPELAQVTPDDWADYDTVFLGYPIWCGSLPMPVRTFLDEHDLGGKTILPFCTNEGSGLARTVDELRNALPDSDIRPGLPVLGSTVQHDPTCARAAVAVWLDDHSSR